MLSGSRMSASFEAAAESIKFYDFKLQAAIFNRQSILWCLDDYSSNGVVPCQSISSIFVSSIPSVLQLGLIEL